MKLDREAIARVLGGVATQADLQALGRENVYAIKSDPNEVHYTPRTKAAPGVNRDERTARYELSNDQQDRSGDVVNIAGIQLKNWQANPVWNFNHDWTGPKSLPIGRPIRSTKKQLEDRRALMVDVKFHEAEKNPFAELVWLLVADGDMPASSIGWRPDGKDGVIRPKSDAERKEFGLGLYGAYLNRIELLEGSSVVVPDNPGALSKKLDALADCGAFSWAVIGELTDRLKQAKGRAFVALQSEKAVEIIDELEQPKPEVKAAPVAETKSAPPGFDESTLRKIIREEVSVVLGAVRVKATDTPAAAEPTRESDPVGFMRSVLEQLRTQ